MSIEISQVNVGDKVRITSENGDESTFTVMGVWSTSLESEKHYFQVDSWDSLEIVESKFVPVPGVYSDREGKRFVVILPDKRAFFTIAGGGWVNDNDAMQPGSYSYDAARQLNGWRRNQEF